MDYSDISENSKGLDQILIIIFIRNVIIWNNNLK